MEAQINLTEQSPSPSLQDCNVTNEGSLNEFKKNVLESGIETEFDDSYSTVPPESSMVCSEYTDDPFEGIYYTTVKEESYINVRFVSAEFYNSFQNKCFSDFADSLQIGVSSCIYTCTTHVKCLRCDLKLDGPNRNVTVTGVGRIVWRKDFFPKIAREIFRQCVESSESQIHGSQMQVSQQGQKMTDFTTYAKPNLMTTTEQPTVTSTPLAERTESHFGNYANRILQPIINCTPIVPSMPSHINVNSQLDYTPVLPTPGLKSTASGRMNSVFSYSDIAPGVPRNLNDRLILNQPVLTNNTVIQPAVGEINLPTSVNGVGISDAALTGKHVLNVNQHERQGVQVPIIPTPYVTGQQVPLFVSTQGNVPHIFGQGSSIHQQINSDAEKTDHRISSERTYSPMFTCEPFLDRTDIHPDNGSQGINACTIAMPVTTGSVQSNISPMNEDTVSLIMQKIKNLEHTINNVKNSFLASLESKLLELKTTLISAMDNTTPRTYADAVQHIPTTNTTSSIDEGFCINISDTADKNSSQTFLKTVHSSNKDAREASTATSRQIPVRITNQHEIVGNTKDNRSHTSKKSINAASVNTGSGIKVYKTLLIGDSILNPVNTKGMIKGIQKHSKSGAKVSDIVDDVTSYNMKSFCNVIISVGGNDASSHTDIELFEEKFDQLISLVKTGNPDCQLFLCYIAPRGDTDATDYNVCIGRLAAHWEKDGVTLIKESESYFYAKDGFPTARYFADDGVHLSNSGVKRLLHAIDSKVHIINNFESCTYPPRRSPARAYYTQSPAGSRPSGNVRPSGRNNSGYRGGNNGYRGGNIGYRGGNNGYRAGNNGYIGRNNARQKRICYRCNIAGHLQRDCWYTQ
ncbi:MAG: hypothetical protein JAY75_14380 [Candidatus Thiodiazotropha taylori]|nr:hypothetical protein [Candidatus Thiodiazotropha taylori]MCG8095276.1 hypothetical protein [Candidatus Thiodiazotropha endolucinida]MCG8032730.1 hypothetical protein [Candidatus Thiodiazotropha taylori]MCG8045804.1 hypothetical protein [Candidatus Thiodiazotropha taylori]MCG8077412.1 hypothetical protein [Candidatus Thiodiazotropha taylori]